MRFLTTPWVVGAAFLVIAPAAAAQDLSSDPPAHVAFVDGSATLYRENQTEPATAGVPVIPGDRIRTNRGRVNILFPDGSALDLDEYSTLDLASPTLLRLTEGRLLLSVAGVNSPASAPRFAVDTPMASAHTYGPGEYRVAVLSGPSGLQTELAVLRGSAALSSDRGTMPVRAAERSSVWDNALPSYPRSFNSARLDAFDQWAAALRDERTGSTSAQYLPADLRMYGGALDRNGTWQDQAPYGRVWAPRVDADWRPYDDGYWSSVPSYGWTWIGADVWSWPTHHYGRWGHGRGGWFWIPDRQWGPAWVSWGTAPGYVSWSPLGYDNRAVFGLSISGGNRWAGWTVVSREHFGGRERRVRQYALSPRSLPERTPFVEHADPPLPSSRSMPGRTVGGESNRGGLPGHASATEVAVPRRAPQAGPRFPVAAPPSREPRAESPRLGTPADRAFEPREGGNSRAARQPAVSPRIVPPTPPPSAEVGGSRGVRTAPRESDGRTYSSRPAPEPPAAAVLPPRIRYGGAGRRSEAPPEAAQAPPSSAAAPLEARPRYGATPRRAEPIPPPATEAARAPEDRAIAPREGRGPRAVARRDRVEAPQPAASNPPPRSESAAPAEPARGGERHGSRRAR
jgi:hypothetical protein